MNFKDVRIVAWLESGMLKEAAKKTADLQRCAYTALKCRKPGFRILQFARDVWLKLLHSQIEMNISVTFERICTVICGEPNLALRGSCEANELFLEQRSRYRDVLEAGELGRFGNDDRLRRRTNLVRIHQS